VAPLPGVGVCVDIGHVAVAVAGWTFRRLAGGPAPRDLAPDTVAEHLPALQASVQAGRLAVLELIGAVRGCGARVHLHLHDGHPVIRGLSDHVSFLRRVPVPFPVDGARSLPPLFGPAGLAQVLAAAVGRGELGRLSLTLEIHQMDGRVPLDDEAARLFEHWRDLTNAERLNYWISVIVANHVLATSLLDEAMGSNTRTTVG